METITALLVGRPEDTAWSKDGVAITSRELSIRVNDTVLPYYHHFFPQAISACSVIFLQGDAEKKVPLPSPMEQRLAEYLGNEERILSRSKSASNTSIVTYVRKKLRLSPQSGYDCASFVHQMNDIPYVYTKIQYENWRSEKMIDQTVLNAGDTVAMGNMVSSTAFHPEHFAIYLLDELFLSILGNGNRLAVTDLETLQQIYNSEIVYRMRPKVRT